MTEKTKLQQHVEDLADAHGLEERQVWLVIEIMGESEAYDGVVTEIEDNTEFVRGL